MEQKEDIGFLEDFKLKKIELFFPEYRPVLKSLEALFWGYQGSRTGGA